MTKDDAWLRGFGLCMSNAIKLGYSNPKDLTGGIPLADFEKCGLEEYDLQEIRKAYDQN